jgi:hypothetical protein
MPVLVTTLDILTERAHLDPQVARAIGDAIENEMQRSSPVTEPMLDVRVAELKSHFDARLSVLEVKTESSKADIVRWIFSALIGQLAVTLGAVYFMLRSGR